ncbi:MAG: KH domain-containing protein [Candidatus Bathyarchaeota archaeon]|nr:KH domain-containing protein [Candidatus Bathyarchaeota archaeon]
MWHVMVYSQGLESPYSRPYAVHLFTREKPAPGEAFRLADEILTNAFPKWRREEDRLVYVGYENIPSVDADNFYYVATKLDVDNFEFKVEGIASTVPQQLASAIEEYRRKHVTLDYDDDEYTRARVIDALEYLTELGCRTRVFRTQRGYHVRAELPSPLSLEKILETREKLEEDYARISVDKAYLQKQLGFLTNLLFNSKCWVTANNTVECYEEKEVDPLSITTIRVETISIPLPQMRIELPKGVVEIDERRIKFIGRFTEKDVKAITTSIEDNLWEYAYVRMREDSDIKSKLVKAYGKISSSLARIAEKCDVRVENGTVVIHVPEHLSEYVGRLIGKQGQNIRAVEGELGMRIRIERTSPPPEDVTIRKRLQELLKNLAEG